MPVAGRGSSKRLRIRARPRNRRSRRPRRVPAGPRRPFPRRTGSGLSRATPGSLWMRGSHRLRCPSWRIGIRCTRRRPVRLQSVCMRCSFPFLFLRWNYPDQVLGSSPRRPLSKLLPISTVGGGQFNLADSHSGCMNGYPQSCGMSSVRFTERGLIHRSRLSGPPALSLVPLALAPPNGCWATTAPVGLSLM